MIRAIICDLDNTLFPPDSIPAGVLEPLFSAMRAANTGPHAIPSALLARALDEGRRRRFDVVAREHDLPPWVLEVWMEANTQLEVDEPLETFPDVSCLWDLSLERFLVTTGFRRFQQSKIRALGLSSRFDAIFIDAVDEPVRAGKAAIFRQILSSEQLAPDEVIVLGDDPDSEIAAGRALGMVTVQILREGVRPAAHATHRIRSCLELAAIVNGGSDAGRRADETAAS